MADLEERNGDEDDGNNQRPESLCFACVLWTLSQELRLLSIS